MFLYDLSTRDSIVTHHLDAHADGRRPVDVHAGPRICAGWHALRVGRALGSGGRLDRPRQFPVFFWSVYIY